MMQKLTCAAVVAAAAASSAGAKELTLDESEAILAKGEIIYTSSELPILLVRNKGAVFYCGFSRKYNASTGDRYAEITCWDTEE